MGCPRCQAEQPEGASECAACGIVFSKLKARARAEAGDSPALAPQPPSDSRLRAEAGVTREGWRALAIGFGLAVALTFFPFLSFILSPLVTLVHELGHTVFNWVYGYPAYPAFDFAHGGGVTVSTGRQIAWVFIGLGGLAWFAYWIRHSTRALVIVCSVGVVYAATAFSDARHLVISAMGHGFELLFAALFLYRGLTGWGCVHAVERPLYAFLAFYITFHNLEFGIGLVGDAYTRQLYIEGKRCIESDLSAVGRQLGWRLVSVARALVIATILGPIAATLAAVERSVFQRLLRSSFGLPEEE